MNLIIGTYNYPNINTNKCSLYYFLKSIRKHNLECKICIVCHKKNFNLILKNLFIEFNVTPLIYDNDESGNIIYTRFKLYYNYLITTDIKFDKIFITDMDDVLVLDNPFNIEFNSGFYLANEGFKFCQNNRHAIYNINAIKDYYNDTDIDYISLFSNRYIFCAGTIFGYLDAIINYLEFYTITQNKFNYKLNDQGLLNIYIHTITKFDYTIPIPYESKIATLNSINIRNIDDKNCYYNANNTQYVILHYNGSSRYTKHNQTLIMSAKKVIDL